MLGLDSARRQQRPAAPPPPPKDPVLAALGQIPDRSGDAVAIDGWTATVLAVDHHAITRIRFSRSAKNTPFGQEHGA